MLLLKPGMSYLWNHLRPPDWSHLNPYKAEMLTLLMDVFCSSPLSPLSRKYREIWRLGWRSFMTLSLRQQKIMQPQEKKKLLNWRRGYLDFRLLEVLLRPVFTCIPLLMSVQSISQLDKIKEAKHSSFNCSDNFWVIGYLSFLVVLYAFKVNSCDLVLYK